MLAIERMEARVVANAHLSTPPRTIALHATFEGLGGKLGGVWHESCARSDALRYPKAVMEADSSSPANIALPLAMSFIVPGLGVIADLLGAPNPAYGEFALLVIYTLYLLHEHGLPSPCACCRAACAASSRRP